MSIDTNAPYKVPEKYQPKNKGFTPKTKASSVLMIILGGILICAITIGGIVGIIFGVSKIIEGVQDSVEPETTIESNVA
jgi:hypothetical protein